MTHDYKRYDHLVPGVNRGVCHGLKSEYPGKAHSLSPNLGADYAPLHQPKSTKQKNQPSSCFEDTTARGLVYFFTIPWRVLHNSLPFRPT